MSKKVSVKKFRKVLVANRGEIAIRIFRALSELGITTVSIYSKEDRYAMFRSKADESYPLNSQKGPIDAYLDIDTIIKIALSTGVDAVSYTHLDVYKRQGEKDSEKITLRVF